jgi:DedD protein
VNDQLKQRLVGAVVLVSLAVIFIPIILPGSGGDSAKLVSKNIPPEPDYRFPPPKKPPKAPSIGNAPIVPIGDSKDTSTSSAKDKKPDENNTAGTADKIQEEKTVAKTEVAKVITTSKQQPVTSEDIKSGQTTGWIVQVGSFSSEPNARALRDKLRKMGYACFVEAVKNNSGMVYRVRVGPELTRASAEKLRDQMTRKAKVKGLVQTYP